MICARFSEPDEWAAEIIRDRDLVQREIARVTKTARPAMDAAATRAHVLASAIVEDRIIMLETYVGDLWGAASDEQVQERASRIARGTERAARGRPRCARRDLGGAVNACIRPRRELQRQLQALLDESAGRAASARQRTQRS